MNLPLAHGGRGGCLASIHGVIPAKAGIHVYESYARMARSAKATTNLSAHLAPLGRGRRAAAGEGKRNHGYLGWAHFSFRAHSTPRPILLIPSPS
jgi:hypothetical protein